VALAIEIVFMTMEQSWSG